MKVGLSSLLFACGRLEEAVEATAKFGYDTIEIVYDLPHFMPGREPEVGRLRKKIRDYSLSVTVHSSFWDLNPASFYPEVRRLTVKRVKKSALFCRELEGEILVVHPGKCPAPDSPQAYGETAGLYREFLDGLVPWVKKLGVKVCLENGNSKDNPYSLLPELGELVAEKGIGITLDLAHAFLRYGPQKVDRILGDLRKVRNLVRHVHLHDNLGQRDDHLIPGEGKLELSKPLNYLKEAGYSSTVVAELWNPRSPWRTAERARKVLEKLL
jgi:sugar phosphate isomerase/epimerase